MSDIEFVNGLVVKAPRDGAPDFVKAQISIRREELISFISSKKGDWINIDVKESKNGKWYASVNNWKPEKQEAQSTPQGQPVVSPDNDFDDTGIPF